MRWLERQIEPPSEERTTTTWEQEEGDTNNLPREEDENYYGHEGREDTRNEELELTQDQLDGEADRVERTKDNQVEEESLEEEELERQGVPTPSSRGPLTVRRGLRYKKKPSPLGYKKLKLTF